jgi:hypothetical protein
VGGFENVPKLRFIDLSNNAIIDPGVFVGLPEVTIDLQGNPLDCGLLNEFRAQHPETTIVYDGC